MRAQLTENQREEIERFRKRIISQPPELYNHQSAINPIKFKLETYKHIL